MNTRKVSLILLVIVVFVFTAGCGVESKVKDMSVGFATDALAGDLDSARDYLAPSLQSDLDGSKTFVADNLGADEAPLSLTIGNVVVDEENAAVELLGEFKCKTINWSFGFQKDSGWKIFTIARGATTEKEGCEE